MGMQITNHGGYKQVPPLAVLQVTREVSKNATNLA